MPPTKERGPYLGVAQIIVPSADDKPELYAALPLYAGERDLALAKRWIADNIKVLAEGGR